MILGRIYLSLSFDSSSVNSWLLWSTFESVLGPRQSIPSSSLRFGSDNNDRFNLQSTSQENVSLPDPRDSWTYGLWIVECLRDLFILARNRSRSNQNIFSQLIVAWTFILSSWWVEILKDAGEMAYLQQSEKMNGCNFWKVVAGQQWRAVVVRGESTFYAPWCLGRHDAASWYAQ